MSFHDYLSPNANIHASDTDSVRFDPNINVNTGAVANNNVHTTPVNNRHINLSQKGRSLHKSYAGVQLYEEVFGNYYDPEGGHHIIKRYTWRNLNKIQVQVINYGARITSIKLPDRNGVLEDIVLGFDDLAGYIYQKGHYFGATIGRTTNRVKNRIFMVGNKRIKLKSHNHFNGGNNGLDQQVFHTFIQGNQVIMSHLSPDRHQGYPGDLLVQVKFELTAKNEFDVKLTAQTTKPTVVNLSNLLYFNLAGHHTGPDEIYKHVLTLNCNCYTLMENGFPTGQICNVLNTPFDFQIPKPLGKVIGIEPHDGYDQNLCVNRGMYQDNCFVARVFHPTSGRMLEIYSNQPGVQFSTANEFGSGYVLTLQEIMQNAVRAKRLMSQPTAEQIEIDQILRVFRKVYQQVTQVLDLDSDGNYKELQQLIAKIRHTCSPASDEDGCHTKIFKIQLTPLQWEYLNRVLSTSCEGEDEKVCHKMWLIVNKLLDDAIVREENFAEATKPVKKNSSLSNIKEFEKKLTITEDGAQFKRTYINEKNVIPKWYRETDQIKGKDRVTYRTHGGIALQTQNYPSSMNIQTFPSCVLYPGQTYEHNIVYRFWMRAANPQKWVKKNLSDIRQKEKRNMQL